MDESKEYIRNKPYVRYDGIYSPTSEYTEKGTEPSYKLLIPKEVFVEAYELWIR